MAVEDRINKWSIKIKEKEDRLMRQIALQKERNNYDTQTTFTKIKNFITCNKKKSENQIEFERIKNKRLAKIARMRKVSDKK